MPLSSAAIAANLAHVRERIAAACDRAGRPAAEVTLVAVTKYVEPDDARRLAELDCGTFGHAELGESRPQELWSKAEALADLPIRWHFVGHLQRNKLRRTLPLVALLHSLDSERLLAAVNDEAAAQGIAVRGLIEVNISGDAAKHGLAPSEVGPLIAHAADFPHVTIAGLMGMSGIDANPDETRRQFRMLRELRDACQSAAPPGVQLRELSMGMSDDYEIAIEEGATLVRIGSALWEPAP